MSHFHSIDYANNEIDPSNGMSLSSFVVSIGGSAVLHAEGLATIGGGLKIAYSPLGDYYSTTLADLGLTGIINGASISTVPGGNDPSPPPPVNFDFDGLGSNVAGTEMYGLDVLPGVSTDFIGIAPTSFSTTEGYVDEAFKQFRNPNDLITIGGDLLAIDHIGKRLHLINLSSGALTSVELLGEGTYVGLASLPVPEPATVALLGVGLAGLAAAEVRRRRKKRAVDKS